MGRPTLHLLGLPHTITRPEWSQCAFTGKVLRFSPMMRAQGYDVIHYGVEGAERGATMQVDVMPAAQQAELLGARRMEPRQGPPDMAHDDPVKIALFTTFNRLLRPLLLKHVSGYRCHTMADWLEGLDRAPRLNRKIIARRAASLYSLEACGAKYARVFEQVAELGNAGWRTPQREALSKSHPPAEPPSEARAFTSGLATYGTV
jgi:hypothetical protein